MEIKPLDIDGSWIAESKILRDNRGTFREWFKLPDLNSATSCNFQVEQANISESSKGTLRGIHYSLAKGGQAKWITCVTGSIRDIVIDIRPDSKTFGKWIEVLLSGESGQAVFIGEGLGHAFLSMQDQTVVAYLTSSPFSSKDEFAINPLDPDIGIKWGLGAAELRISEKDFHAPGLKEREAEGKLPKKYRH